MAHVRMVLYVLSVGESKRRRRRRTDLVVRNDHSYTEVVVPLDNMHRRPSPGLEDLSHSSSVSRRRGERSLGCTLQLSMTWLKPFPPISINAIPSCTNPNPGRFPSFPISLSASVLGSLRGEAGLTNLDIAKSDSQSLHAVRPNCTGDVGARDPQYRSRRVLGRTERRESLVRSGEVDGVVEWDDGTRAQVHCRSSVCSIPTSATDRARCGGTYTRREG